MRAAAAQTTAVDPRILEMEGRDPQGHLVKPTPLLGHLQQVPVKPLLEHLIM